MAVKWQKIYRGPVTQTTPVTREAQTDLTTSILPGMALSLDAADKTKFIYAVTKQGTVGTDPDPFWYICGENLHKTVDDDYVIGVADANRSIIRAYQPRSGELYAVRVVAGIALTDDLPLSFAPNGLFKAWEDGEVIRAYVDDPSSARPNTDPQTTVANQIIPVKIRGVL